jgi:hypothetical protein
MWWGSTCGALFEEIRTKFISSICARRASVVPRSE